MSLLPGKNKKEFDWRVSRLPKRRRPDTNAYASARAVIIATQGSDKPGSVSSCPKARNASPFIQARRCRRARSTYPHCPVKDRRSRRLPTRSGTTLRGISTHGVYPTTVLPRRLVRSYRTFSPLPFPEEKGGLAFCGTFRSLRIPPRPPAVSRRGALCCPDFPLAVIPKDAASGEVGLSCGLGTMPGEN